MTARLAALIVVISVSAAGGCSYNPGYFPWILPPGRIEQTHAKPRFGYFKNFDPKAHHIGVAPGGHVNAPLGSQIVLVASVYDKDGQPRRSRRVEWMIEGPGNIIEADASGVYAGRGYKVDNKYAVTYTSYIPKTISRGNDDTKDDVAIEPGQTFIVISSAVPGETTITSYAPEVFNWENNRAVTKIHWGDQRFSFPDPVAARVGGEAKLATGVAGDNPGANYRVRYRVIDGPAVVLVSGDGGTSLSGVGGKETEAIPDGGGEAAVRVVQRDPKPGRTRVAVEVVKPPENGIGAGTIVGKREAVVEWTMPDVKLKVTAPPAAAMNGTFPVTVVLDNVSGVESKEARVRVKLSDGAVLASSEPPPARADEQGGLIFDLPPVSGNSKETITLQVKPARLGSVTIAADAVTGDGLQANTSAATRIENGKLQLIVEGPPIALAGERMIARIAVTNSGAAPVNNVAIWARFDEGLTAGTDPGRGPVEIPGGTIAPGETKTFDLPLTAKATGRYSVRATATGDGNLSASADPISFEVRRGELAAAITGPKLVYLNQEVSWVIAVANRGDAAVANVTVRATLPPELKITDAESGTVGPGSVEWKLDSLRPGEQKSFKLTGDAIKLAPESGITVAVLGDATSNGKPVGTPVEGKAEAKVSIIGTAALSLEVTPPSGTVETGKRVQYQIRVKNQGTISARNVAVGALASPELKLIRGAGAGEGRIGAERVLFPPVEELQPGQTLTYIVEVEAARPGDARFTAEVAAPNLRNPLKEEQATRITGK